MAYVHAGSEWDHRQLVMLIGGVLLPPFAWLLDLQVSYSLVKWACANDRSWILFVTPIASLTLIAVAGVMSWSSWNLARPTAREDGERPVDRSYLLALSGLALTALFGLLVLVSLAPRAVLSPCE
jgi:hypothetical protein